MQHLQTTASVLIILWSLAALYVLYQMYLYFENQTTEAAAVGEGVYTYTFKQMVKEAMTP